MLGPSCCCRLYRGRTEGEKCQDRESGRGLPVVLGPLNPFVHGRFRPTLRTATRKVSPFTRVVALAGAASNRLERREVDAPRSPCEVAEMLVLLESDAEQPPPSPLRGDLRLFNVFEDRGL